MLYQSIEVLLIQSLVKQSLVMVPYYQIKSVLWSGTTVRNMLEKKVEVYTESGKVSILKENLGHVILGKPRIQRMHRGFDRVRAS